MNQVKAILLAVLLFYLFFKLLLEFLNINYLKKHQSNNPGGYDSDELEKSVSYSLDKHHFNLFQIIFNSTILTLLIFSDIIPIFYNKIIPISEEILSQTAFVILFFLFFSVLSLPLEYYQQFKIEEKHGFNKSTIKIWIFDKIKGFVLSLLIGVPLLSLILIIFQNIGNLWWVYCAVVLILFQLLMMFFFPVLIMPLFNKFTPLDNGDLKDNLNALAKKTGFFTKRIMIMDGSKRSAHSNAFFTGLGKYRKVVLFDTLVNQLSTLELNAVLAHEIGHFKLGHIPKRLLFAFISIFISFFVLDIFINSQFIFNDLGFAQPTFAVALLYLSLCGGLFTFWLTPIFNYFSRKHEYQADKYAVDHADQPSAIIDALKKLSQKNLSNQNTHPWYSRFYYSHPTLAERNKAIKNHLPG